MKVLIYTDPHFSSTTSILTNTSGYKYSARLDMLIDSFKWIYEQAHTHKVDCICNLGDLLDKTEVSSRELSALAEALSCNKYSIPEYHLIGNHDKDSELLNSVSIIGVSPLINVITKPTIIHDQLYCVPYTNDTSSIDFQSVVDVMDNNNNKYLLSHLTYQGMMIGYKELSGLSQSLVCGLFTKVFNGHIHTSSRISDNKVINVGSVFGYGFNDDYSVSIPNIIILDTLDNSTIRIPNPKSCLFYKKSFKYTTDLITLFNELLKLSNPKCISLEVPFSLRDNVESIINDYSEKLNLVQYRVRSIVTSETTLTDITNNNDSTEEITVNHKFKSGINAFSTYLNDAADSDLPYQKSRFQEFFDEYLLEEGIK